MPSASPNSVRDLRAASVNSDASSKKNVGDNSQWEAWVKRQLALYASQPINTDMIGKIQRATAAHFRIHPQDLEIQNRVKEIVHARQVAIFVCTRHSRAGIGVIARRFGQRDVSTIRHAVARVQKMIDAGHPIRTDIAAIEMRL